ncbi:MAG: hypothetical protein HYX72_10350 [Acidobacteria bacterium]|nr:hypothetical protein [Acidobacteriota bacterium]
MRVPKVDRASEKEAVTQTLTALNRRLEGIRREHLARNRSNLREFSIEQLQEVERLTAAITAKIFVEVASELEHSAAAGRGRETSQAVSLMLGLASNE